MSSLSASITTRTEPSKAQERSGHRGGPFGAVLRGLIDQQGLERVFQHLSAPYNARRLDGVPILF